jgi:hypothetical protein
MKIKVVPSKDLTAKNLTAKYYVLGPERTAVVSFEGTLTLKFHGEVGEEDYERALKRRVENAAKNGIKVGSINNVDDGSGG